MSSPSWKLYPGITAKLFSLNMPHFCSWSLHLLCRSGQVYLRIKLVRILLLQRHVLVQAVIVILFCDSFYDPDLSPSFLPTKEAEVNTVHIDELAWSNSLPNLDTLPVARIMSGRPMSDKHNERCSNPSNRTGLCGWSKVWLKSTVWLIKKLPGPSKWVKTCYQTISVGLVSFPY